MSYIELTLIRTLIAEACRNTERLPIQVSFKGVIQLFNSFVSLLSFSADCNKAHAILLHAIIKTRLGIGLDGLNLGLLKTSQSIQATE
ncbi:hypothetical protein GW537_19325 (plasmid) [Piscirickettsia salmonis]|uniref:hypothetical protein n=1 Tax=Piscirickettsia salmonis TaxID=1238 RepID=UPI00137BDDBF|nr:hypothetical protein [Piscirickettsia salmonis]QHS31132.1 hypothetical protein GW537_19325 [Piscirickettsia salmonis]